MKMLCQSFTAKYRRSREVMKIILFGASSMLLAAASASQERNACSSKSSITDDIVKKTDIELRNELKVETQKRDKLNSELEMLAKRIEECTAEIQKCEDSIQIINGKLSSFGADDLDSSFSDTDPGESGDHDDIDQSTKSEETVENTKEVPDQLKLKLKMMQKVNTDLTARLYHQKQSFYDQADQIKQNFNDQADQIKHENFNLLKELRAANERAFETEDSLQEAISSYNRLSAKHFDNGARNYLLLMIVTRAALEKWKYNCLGKFSKESIQIVAERWMNDKVNQKLKKEAAQTFNNLMYINTLGNELAHFGSVITRDTIDRSRHDIDAEINLQNYEFSNADTAYLLEDLSKKYKSISETQSFTPKMSKVCKDTELFINDWLKQFAPYVHGANTLRANGIKIFIGDNCPHVEKGCVFPNKKAAFGF